MQVQRCNTWFENRFRTFACSLLIGYQNEVVSCEMSFAINWYLLSFGKCELIASKPNHQRWYHYTRWSTFPSGRRMKNLRHHPISSRKSCNEISLRLSSEWNRTATSSTVRSFWKLNFTRTLGQYLKIALLKIDHVHVMSTPIGNVGRSHNRFHEPTLWPQGFQLTFLLVTGTGVYCFWLDIDHSFRTVMIHKVDNIVKLIRLEHQKFICVKQSCKVELIASYLTHKCRVVSMSYQVSIRISGECGIVNSQIYSLISLLVSYQL